MTTYYIDDDFIKEYEDKIQEYQVKSYKDFLASKGLNIYKLKGDDHVKYSKMYKQEKDSAHQDATAKKGTDDHKTYTPSTADSPAKIEDETNERVGGMSDIHIGAQEVVGEYTDEDGNLKMPKELLITEANNPFHKIIAAVFKEKNVNVL